MKELCYFSLFLCTKSLNLMCISHLLYFWNWTSYKYDSESCSVLSHFLLPHGLYSPWNSQGQNAGVGSHSLLQGIFPTQGSNPGLLHYKWSLYQLSHQESPRILEWVAYSFFRGSSWPRNWTGVSCTAGRFFYTWATRKAHYKYMNLYLAGGYPTGQGNSKHSLFSISFLSLKSLKLWWEQSVMWTPKTYCYHLSLSSGLPCIFYLLMHLFHS